MWAIVFAIVVASFGFLRLTLKRTLQDKIEATNDYMMWMAYRDPITYLYSNPVEYKGSTNIMSKGLGNNKLTVRQVEAHKKPVRTLINSTQDERSAHSTVASDNEAILKTFDLDATVK